jgi:hypothetical protein
MLNPSGCSNSISRCSISADFRFIFDAQMAIERGAPDTESLGAGELPSSAAFAAEYSLATPVELSDCTHETIDAYYNERSKASAARSCAKAREACHCHDACCRRMLVAILECSVENN